MRIRFALATAYMLALLVTACAAYQPQEEAPTIESVQQAEPVEAAPEPRPCGKIDRDWLKQLKAAEGSILVHFEVSRARRGQVEQLSGQLGKIEAELKKHGCVEIKR